MWRVGTILAALTLVFAGMAFADGVGTDLPGSCLGVYDAGNPDQTPTPVLLSAVLAAGPCTVGSQYVLSNFFFDSGSATGGSFATADQIDALFTYNSRIPDLLTIGLTGFPSVDASQSAYYRLRVTIDLGPIIGSDSAAEDPPFGNIPGVQYYCPNGTLEYDGTIHSGLLPYGCTSTRTLPTGTFNVNSPFYTTFDPPLYLLDTDTIFTLNPDAANGQGQASSLDGIVNTAGPPVPEPAAWQLMALCAGCVALVVKRRRG